MNNRGDIAVPNEPNTTQRDLANNAISLLSRHSEKVIQKVAGLSSAGRANLKAHLDAYDENLRLQQKKDFLKTTPRRLMLATFVLAGIVYAGLIYLFPDLESLVSYAKGFGKHVKWVYYIGILLPMSCSVSLIAKFSMLRDGFPQHSDPEFNDRFGRILLMYYDPYHYEATSAYPQHAYTASDIYAHLSDHLGETMPPDMTPKSIEHYLVDKIKVDRLYKKQAGRGRVFFLPMRQLAKSTETPAPQNEPSNPANDDN